MKAPFIEPMLCGATSELPLGPEWSYELKLDGYRGLAIKTGGLRKLLSRNGKDLSTRFPEIARALQPLPDDTMIDGEIVALDAEGRPSFSVLQKFPRA
jgi:ATP-dependent DNA ligase